MHTKSLLMSEISKENLIALHSWRNSECFRRLCSVRRHIVSLEEFSEELESDFARDRDIQFIGIRKRDNLPVGTIWAYSVNPIDGHCFVSTFVAEEYRGIGYGIELFASTMTHLFLSVPNLHKIYTEVYAYNLSSLSIMRKFGFQEEGCFLGHRLMNGERFDLYRLAFYRKQFDERFEFISRFLD